MVCGCGLHGGLFFFLGQKATKDFRPDISEKNYTFDDVQGVSLLFLLCFSFWSVGLKGKHPKNLHARIAPIIH